MARMVIAIAGSLIPVAIVKITIVTYFNRY